MASDARRKSVRLIVLTLAVLGLGWLAWDAAIKPNLVPKNFGVVSPGKVYRSGELTDTALRKVITEHGIRTIIDLGAWEQGSREDIREQKTAEELGVERYWFKLYGDATGNPNHYVQALRLMTDPQKQPVLVHCGAGSERTGCAVILFRRLTDGKSVDESLAEARSFRHDPGRNPRMLTTLADWGDRIIGAYKSGTQIEGVEASEAKPVSSAALSARTSR